MPHQEKKFEKYVYKITAENPSEERVFAELEQHVEKNKNMSLTLLYDDFFPDSRQYAAVSRISSFTVTPYHNHNFYELNYVAFGSCAQLIEGRNLMLRTGDLLLMRPDTFHCVYPIENSVCFNVLIRTECAERLEKAFRNAMPSIYFSELLKKKSYMIFSSPEPENTEKIIEEIAEASKKSVASPLYCVSAESSAARLLAAVSEYPRLSFAYSGANHSSGLKNSPEIFLDFIRRNITTVTLESAAAYFGYTPAHFSRLVKKYTGSSFSAFVTTQRLLTAEKLLSETGIPIGSIPAMTGLESAEYFSRMFKKHNGTTPSQFRRLHRR